MQGNLDYHNTGFKPILQSIMCNATYGKFIMKLQTEKWQKKCYYVIHPCREFSLWHINEAYFTFISVENVAEGLVNCQVDLPKIT